MLMATATEPRIEVERAEEPFSITSDMFSDMVETALIPQDRRVFLWDGRLYEKMAKSKAHAAIHDAVGVVLSRRLPVGFYCGIERPIVLDEKHTPLPDLVVLRGQPHDYLNRYPSGSDVVLVVEVAVTSLSRDLGPRRAHYALTLPEACYMVVDVKSHCILVHRKPQAEPAGYAEVETVGPGQAIRLTIGGVELAPIPFEEVMRSM